MDATYKIQVKLGSAEFTAEGPEALVKDAYEKFLAAAATPAAVPPPPRRPANGADPAPPGDSASIELLNRVFKRDGEIVSLRLLPQDGDSRAADSAVLLLYGFRTVLEVSEVPVMKLNRALRVSGISLDRLDRVIERHSPLYNKGGVKSGGRYTLNNQGVAWAEKFINERFT
jgi:hypothetical protein